MQRQGPYLVKGRLRREGAIEVLEGLDPLTGGIVVLYRPLQTDPPALALEGVLAYRGRVGDAWVVEVPFGAAPAVRYRGEADLGRLEAWARRLLATLSALEEQGLAHGHLSLGDLWVRGEMIWVSGVAVPWEEKIPDAVGLGAVLKELAGEAWAAWRLAPLFEALAEGRLNYGDAMNALADPMAFEAFLKGELEPPEPKGDDILPKPQPSVSVKPKAPAKEKTDEPEPDGAEKAQTPPPAPPVSTGEGIVRVRKKDGSPPPLLPGEDPPEALRLDPGASPEPRRSGRRRVFVWLLVLALLAGGAFWYQSRRPGFSGQVVRFVVEPPEAQAEIYLQLAPEGSKLAPGFLAEVPGSVRFDEQGTYRLEVRAEGYKPQDFDLEVPVLGGSVVIRLGGQ